MRRLFILVLLLGFFGALFCAAPASAGFSKGDESKLRGFFSVLLDHFADDKERAGEYEDYQKFWEDKRKVKMLKEVGDLAELMAASARRPDSRRGVLLKQFDVKKDLNIPDTREKYSFVISVPEKYRSTEQTPAWPLIVCIPDEGEKPSDYLDKHWKNAAIRENYLIAVFGHDYKPVKVMVNKEEKEGDKVTIVQEEIEAPFTWDCDPALWRFWGGLFLVQIRDFKVDPNRVFLDGTGRGASGALLYAAASTYRFAGVVMRGGESDSPTLPNLAHLKVLALPSGSAGEGTAKTLKALKEVMPAGALTEVPAAETGLASPAWDGGSEDASELKKWLDGTSRNRYPLPSRWVRQAASEQYGYWVAVDSVFDAEKVAEITVNSDPKRGRVDVECRNVERFSLYVNDILVDLEKPIELFVNGEKLGVYEKTRSAEQLLDHAINKPPYDVGAVFTQEIINIRLKAPPEEPEDPKKPEDESGK